MAQIDLALVRERVFAANGDDLALGVLRVDLDFAVNGGVLHAGHRTGHARAHARDFVGCGACGSGTGERSRDRGSTGFARVAQAQLELQVSGERALDARHVAVAQVMVERVFGAQRLGLERGLLADLVGKPGTGLSASLAKVGSGVVECGIGARDEGLCLELLAVMLQMDAARIALPHRRGALGARDFRHHRGALAQAHDRMCAAQLEGIRRIAVFGEGGAHRDVVGDLHVGIPAEDPELGTSLVDFVGDANRDGIELLVDARHRRLEEDAPGEGLHLVVVEARLRGRGEDERRTVAVAREDLDLLAVHQPRGRGKHVRPRGAVGADFLDLLARGIAAGEEVRLQATVLVVLLRAGERAAVRREAAHVGIAERVEVAI